MGEEKIVQNKSLDNPLINKSEYPENPLAKSFDNSKSEETVKENLKNLTRDEKLDKVEKSIEKIAQIMILKKTNLSQIFMSKIQLYPLEDTKVMVISTQDFIEGLIDLGLKFTSTADIINLINWFSLDQNKKYIQVHELIKLLEDFGIKDSITNGDNFEESTIVYLNYKILDKEGMSILYQIFMNYIGSNDDNNIKNHLPITESKITSSKNKIISLDFFKILENVAGIQLNALDKERLQAFFVNDEYDQNFICMQKFREAMKDMLKNDQLKEMAKACFEELQNTKNYQKHNEEDNPQDQQKYTNLEVQKIINH